MTKVKLSVSEMDLVTNASIILTKNEIIKKVYDLFGDLSDNYVLQVKSSNIKDELNSKPPKISKGESYLGLPWVMLDYPRIFQHNDICSIRTFFWWGNYCAIFIILKGKYCNESAIKQVALTNLNGWKMGIDEESLWHHKIDEKHYAPFDIEKINITELGFLKLAKKIPLIEWDHTEVFMKEGFETLINCIKCLST